METVKRAPGRYGKVFKGHTIPYGTLAEASYEVKQAYYYHGYRNDEDMPELPVGSVYDNEEPPPDPDEVVARNEMHRVVQEMLEGLTRREAQVLRMRFGIDTDADLSLEEVGIRFDVTRERIRQIEAKALRKFKHPSRSDVLIQFIRPEAIETSVDKGWQLKRLTEKLIRQDIEIQAQIIVKRSTRPELRQPRPDDLSWVEFLKHNAPDVYAAFKTHVERYASKFLPR